jgi:glycosyltransferase involved in cell wall biosynthesis
MLRALESLKQQTVQGFKIIIVNDASTHQETNEITEKLAGQEHLSVVRHSKNLGLSGARNSGFQQMCNSIAMPLDADDTLPPEAVKQTLEAFNRHPEAEMIFGDYLIVSNGVAAPKKVSCASLAPLNMELSIEALARNWILMGQSPCKKSLWEKIEGYSPEFTNTVQDVDFWRRAALAGLKGYYTNAVLYHWHRSDTGMNNQVKEEDYLPLRIKSLPFYDRFNPEFGLEIRQYIYRYYAARLMSTPLDLFVKRERAHFTFLQRLKVKIMMAPFFYKSCRTLKNKLAWPFRK